MAAITEPRLYAFKAGTTFAAKQYCFAKFGAADDTVVPATAGDETVGVMQEAPAINVAGSVACEGGGAKLLIGDTVTRGQYLKSDANGAGIPVTTDKDKYGAKAMASGVVGDVIPVEVVQGQASI